MKKVFASIIILAILGINTVLAAPVENGTVYISENVKIQIHPNAELLGIVYYLAFGNDTFVIDRGDYIEEVEAHFGKYRGSEAVSLLRDYLARAQSISERDYYIMQLEYYLLLCSEPPELRPLRNTGFSWFENVFLPALREFANKTNFMEFYHTHQRYYLEDLTVYKGALSLLPPDQFMRANAGISDVKYVFLHPYLLAVHGHSFSPKISGTQYWGAGGIIPLVRRMPQRTLRSYRTARDTMFGLSLNRDIINSTSLDELMYLGFIYHELGHDVTLPALYLSNVEDYAYLQDAIEEDMEYLAKYDMHFWNPIGMIYEGFADAWEDYALTNVNVNYSLLSMNMQKAWGEFWIDHLFYALQNCSREVRAGRYPNLTICVPDALNSLKKLASPENVSLVYEIKVPVTPVRVLDKAAQAGKITIVYGTQNSDESETEHHKEIAEAIAKNLREFYSQWPSWVRIVIKPDLNVTRSDLNSTLLLIGTPSTNRIVDIFDDYFPLRLERASEGWRIVRENNVTSFLLLDDESPLRSVYGNTSVVAGGLQTVDKAALLMASVNPYNTYYYVVWIAGTDGNMTRLFKNPTYYLSSYEIWTPRAIEVGFYNKPLAERLSESFNTTLLLSPQTTTTTTTTVRTDTTTAPETTTTSATTTTSTTKSTTRTSTTSTSRAQSTSQVETSRTTATDKNMCGPAALVGLAIIPLLIRRRR